MLDLEDMPERFCIAIAVFVVRISRVQGLRVDAFDKSGRRVIAGMRP